MKIKSLFLGFIVCIPLFTNAKEEVKLMQTEREIISFLESITLSHLSLQDNRVIFKDYLDNKIMYTQPLGLCHRTIDALVLQQAFGGITLPIMKECQDCIKKGKVPEHKVEELLAKMESEDGNLEMAYLRFIDLINFPFIMEGNKENILRELKELKEEDAALYQHRCAEKDPEECFKKLNDLCTQRTNFLKALFEGDSHELEKMNPEKLSLPSHPTLQGDLEFFKKRLCQSSLNSKIIQACQLLKKCGK